MQGIPILNLQAQYASLKDEIDAAIQKVIDGQHFILGTEVSQFEGEIAAYCGTTHAVGVASGTDALLLALKAAGICPGDEVLVPAMSFVASADSVSLLGATPVFVDVDPQTYLIDLDQLDHHLTDRTRAVMPVHLYGQAVDMHKLTSFAVQHNLSVIGDAAQALGSTCNSSPVCSFGDFGCISFFPSKNLGAYGDGGMIVTSDKDHASLLKMLRSHGSSKKYTSEFLGWNSRLDEIQAAILRVKLPHLNAWNAARQNRAALYNDVLANIDGVTLPSIGDSRSHVFHQYTLRVPNRGIVQSELLSLGIEAAIHYPIPLHLQPMYHDRGYRRGDLPIAEQACNEVLSLPMYPELTDGQIEWIGDALRQAVANCATAITC